MRASAEGRVSYQAEALNQQRFVGADASLSAAQMTRAAEAGRRR